METTSPLVGMYDIYRCLRNILNTTAAYQPLHVNGEAILPTALVMLLEDSDARLAARFESERCPQPIAVPTSTKQASTYSRSAIAKDAHYYAKATIGGSYHKRFGKGMKAAWEAAKQSSGFDVHTVKIPLVAAVPKPVKIPTRTTYPNLFDHDIIYYSPKQYAPFTESKAFNSTRNYSLHY